MMRPRGPLWRATPGCHHLAVTPPCPRIFGLSNSRLDLRPAPLRPRLGARSLRERSGRIEMHYTFADYALDPERRELTRGSDGVAIGPKVFDLLLSLVENRKHVVSKNDLLDVVWEGRIVRSEEQTTETK